MFDENAKLRKDEIEQLKSKLFNIETRLKTFREKMKAACDKPMSEEARAKADKLDEQLSELQERLLQ